MISWLQARDMIILSRGSTIDRPGPYPGTTQFIGMTVFSFLVSRFGFHFEDPNRTDFRWDGMSALASQFQVGVANPQCQPIQVGIAFDRRPFCFLGSYDDYSGLRAFWDDLQLSPDITKRFAEGDIAYLVDGFFNQQGGAYPDTYAWTESIRMQFRDARTMEDALFAAFGRYERDTGKDSGWELRGASPSGYRKGGSREDYSMLLPAGASVSTDGGSQPGASESDDNGILVAGLAAVAIVGGIVYATRKGKLWLSAIQRRTTQ